MERRKFLGTLPIAVGGALTFSAVNATAQTQPSSVYVTVKQFGAIGNGTTDDTAAIKAAFAYAASQAYPICVFFPDGEYLVSAGFTVPVGVAVRGSGRGSAIIVVNAAGIVVFSTSFSSYTSANISILDLSIQTAKSGVVGIKFTLCGMTNIERVAFLGLAQCIEIDRGDFHQISNCISAGYGATNPAGTCRFWSSDDNDYVYSVTVSGFMVNNVGTGVSSAIDPAAFYIRRGISIFFVNVKAGDLVTGGVATGFILIENDSQGCKFVSCVASLMTVGIALSQGGGVAVSPSFTEFHGVDIDQPIQYAINLASASFTNFYGCNITPSGSHAAIQPIVIDTNATHTSFNGTMVYNFNGAGGCGFYFNGATHVDLTNCIVDSCYYAFVFAGGSHIRINGGSVSNCTNKYNGTPSGNGNYFSHVDGFNPLGVITPPFPSTGSTVTNALGVRCSVYISGGSITAISINGQVIPSGITGGAFDLEPGDTIDMNYSGSPSWKWIGH